MWLAAQLCPTLCDRLDYSLPGSSVHGIFQARTLERVAISFSRGSSWPRDQADIFCVSCIAGEFFTCWSISKAQPEFKSPLFGRLWEQDFSLVKQDITDKQRREARMSHGMFNKNYRSQGKLRISFTQI